MSWMSFVHQFIVTTFRYCCKNECEQLGFFFSALKKEEIINQYIINFTTTMQGRSFLPDVIQGPGIHFVISLSIFFYRVPTLPSGCTSHHGTMASHHGTLENWLFVSPSVCSTEILLFLLLLCFLFGWFWLFPPISLAYNIEMCAQTLLSVWDC